MYGGCRRSFFSHQNSLIVSEVWQGCNGQRETAAQVPRRVSSRRGRLPESLLRYGGRAARNGTRVPKKGTRARARALRARTWWVLFEHRYEFPRRSTLAHRESNVRNETLSFINRRSRSWRMAARSARFHPRNITTELVYSYFCWPAAIGNALSRYSLVQARSFLHRVFESRVTRRHMRAYTRHVSIMWTSYIK